jgi:hypothetical protein
VVDLLLNELNFSVRLIDKTQKCKSLIDASSSIQNLRGLYSLEHFDSFVDICGNSFAL